MADTSVATSTTREFIVDELEALGLGLGGSRPAIVRSITRHRRTFLVPVAVIVFEHEGELWRVERFDPNREDRKAGLTETWISDPVTAVQVEAYEVPVTQYRAQKRAEAEARNAARGPERRRAAHR